MNLSSELTPWTERNNREVIEHIIDRYHEPLREAFACLTPLAAKVLRAQGEGGPDPHLIGEIVQTYTRLRGDLEPHMEWEERVLFPWILSGRPIPTGGPVHVGIHEHDHATSLLDLLKSMTNGFQVPSGASSAIAALWNGLASLECDMREHILLENEVLFPRVQSQVR